MSRLDVGLRALAVVLGVATAGNGCGSTPSRSAAVGGSMGQAGSAAQGGQSGGISSTAGSDGTAGQSGTAGNGFGDDDGGSLGIAGGSGGAGSNGGTGDGGTAGRGPGGAGQGGAAGGGAAAGLGTCALPSPVAFQKDIQPFLTTTCGGGSGCHVIDGASTTSSGGYDHAYDWITAGAHPSSCPETPTPKRFQVVLDVIARANPSTCSKSRIMPPQDETGANLRKPLTTCQIALLQGWLGEPLVTQAHRVDDTDPAGTAPFPMPPFN